MIVTFTVGNFRSFKDKMTLDFRATSQTELEENIATLNQGEKDEEKLLRTIAIYGANSSGKSNLIKGLQRMKEMVLGAVKLNPGDELPYTPFLLSTETEGQPTSFEIEYIHEDNRFRYGFDYDKTRIINEWLFKIEKGKELPLFARDEDGIEVNKKNFPEGKGLETKTTDNRLFLSLVAQLNGEVANKVLDWYDEGLLVLSGIEHSTLENGSLSLINVSQNRGASYINDSLFQPLKLGFSKINTVKEEGRGDKFILETHHSKYNTDGIVVDSVKNDYADFESEGTKKIIHLSQPIIRAVIENMVIIIDELDSKLHPILTRQLIKFLISPKTLLSFCDDEHPQLLFTTHDTNLLSSEILRRDQIWFTEKDPVEQTDLYCLADIQLPDGSKIRKDANLEKNYINGRYGAIPYLSNND